MKIKIGLIVIAVLALAQLLFYSATVRDTAQSVRQENQSLDNDIRELESRASRLKKQRQELREKAQSIPPEFVARFQDPETGFMEYLNFLNNPLLEDAGVDISLSSRPSFTTNPIPHHESEFSFSFSFLQPQKAERVFNYLVHQKRFPVRVVDLSLSGGGSKEVSADMDISLLIPARHADPLNIIEEEQ